MKQKIFDNTAQTFKKFEHDLAQAMAFKESFETRQTTYSAQLLFRNENIKYLYTYEPNKFEVLGKIMQLKAHLKRLPDKLLNLPKIGPSQINYFQFSPKISAMRKRTGEILEFKNVVEIDLTSAYMHAAKKLGIINDELFNALNFRGKDTAGNWIPRDKSDRLKILGSMAVCTLVDFYEQGRKIESRSERIANESFRNLWFYICAEVDAVFQFIARNVPRSKFLFYYVDGVYVLDDPETEKIILSAFSKNGFSQFKRTELTCFCIVNKSNFVTIEIKKLDGKEKTFSVPFKSVRYYYID